MRAIQIVDDKGPSGLRALKSRVPLRADDEVLIDVMAAGVAFPALLQSRGAYQIQPPYPFIPGSEIAGIVREAPPESAVEPGQRVAGFSFQGGGYAEVIGVPGTTVFPLPDTVPFAVGAALPGNYLTAYYALAERAALAKREIVLVHGAAGGVGTASIQVAKLLGAGRVVAVVSTTEKGQLALAAGAHDYVLVTRFKDEVMHVLDGGMVDVVIDPVGGDRILDSLRCLGPEGRYLVIGFTAGHIPEVKVNRLLLRDVSLVGVRTGMGLKLKPERAQEYWNALMQGHEQGMINPVLGPTYPLEAAGAALEALETRSALGKLVLQVR
jgi:NADPH2:quinone reductase